MSNSIHHQQQLYQHQSKYSPSIVEINNKAVMALESRQLQEAMDGFTLALRLSKEWVISCCDANVAQREQQGRHCSLDELMRRSFQDNSEDEEQRPAPSPQQSYIYRKAIPMTSDVVGDNYDESSTVLLSCILFNLALAYQMSVENLHYDDARRITNLEKAVKLYEMSYNAAKQRTGDDDDGSSHNDGGDDDTGVTPLFAMATVNNMAIIYRSLNKPEESESLLQHLLSTIVYLTDCGEGKLVSEFQGFFQNVSPLMAKSCTAAAA